MHHVTAHGVGTLLTVTAEYAPYKVYRATSELSFEFPHHSCAGFAGEIALHLVIAGMAPEQVDPTYSITLHDFAHSDVGRSVQASGTGYTFPVVFTALLLDTDDPIAAATVSGLYEGELTIEFDTNQNIENELEVAGLRTSAGGVGVHSQTGHGFGGSHLGAWSSVQSDCDMP